MLARGTQIIAAVAQLPGGTSSNLATLVPLLFHDGTAVEDGDFPENDLVFWNIRNRDVSLNLTPGTVILASVEETDHGLLPKNPGDHHLYRAEAGSVREPSGNEICEVLQSTSLQIQHPRDLLRPNQIVLNHRPTSRVYIQTSDSFYGPFLSEANPSDDSLSYFAITLKPLHESVDIIPMSFISALGVVKQVSATVSLRPIPPNRSNQTGRCVYQLLLAQDLSALNSAAKQTVHLRTPEQILRPLIKRFFQIGRYRSAAEQFHEFVSMYAEDHSLSTPVQTEIVEAVRTASSQDKRILRELSDSLLASGLLKETLDERIRIETDSYISAKSIELSAQIRERLQDKQSALDNLEKTLSSRQSEFEAQLRQQREAVNAERTAFEYQRTLDLKQIASELSELKIQRQTVAEYLEATVNRFRDDRKNVIGELLTILPLLDTGHSASDLPGTASTPQVEGNEEVIDLPTLVRRTGVQFVRLDEEHFFNRFCGHVESCGFQYRELDLLAFHLNFKTSDFFVLGGLSGTGKSSLPQLYAQALAGDTNAAEERLLRIPVNPTWLEVADILGRVNMIDRTFNPAESGLVRHLIHATIEFEERGQDSGFWPVVLDEMNLAQVEHYFGPFVQMFGSEQERDLRLFDPAVVNRMNPFWRWARIRIPVTTRFIGTINFDETTRSLSPRLLDRAAVMSVGLAPRTTSVTSNRTAPGRPILQRHLDEWKGTSGLSQVEAAFLDDIQVDLAKLGCPLTPRRRKAIERFRAGATVGISSETAFDLLLSQRVLPHIRSLFRGSSRDALDVLANKLADAAFDLPESERVLVEVREREEAGTAF